jgi:hypothetical protein
MLQSPITTRIVLPAAAVLGALLAGCGAGTSALTGGTSPTLPNQSLDGTTAGAHTASGAPVGTTNAEGTTRRAGVFVTGDAPAGYAHAWVTLEKVELIDGAEKATTIWESRGGMSLDLTTLHDHDGALYAVVTSAAVPSGKPNNRVRVTLGKALLAYAPGATVADTLPLSDSLPRDADGRPVLSFSLAHPRDLGTGKADIVIDFDAAKSTVTGGRADLSLADGSKAARAALLADRSRQIPAFFSGTVADAAAGPAASAAASPAASAAPAAPAGGIVGGAPGASPTPGSVLASPTAMAATAPAPGRAAHGANSKAAQIAANPTFTLQDVGGSVVVEMGGVAPEYPDAAATAAASTGSATSATVAATPAVPAPAATAGPAPKATVRVPTAGERVWVRGILSEETKRIIPSEIVVLPAAPADDASADASTAPPRPDTDAAVVGSPASVTAGTGTFALAEGQVYGLLPTQRSVTVIVGKQTVVRDAAGAALPPNDLYTALQRPDAAVEAAGAYDPVTGTLTATRVALEPSAPAPAASPASPSAPAASPSAPSASAPAGSMSVKVQ